MRKKLIILRNNKNGIDRIITRLKKELIEGIKNKKIKYMQLENGC